MKFRGIELQKLQKEDYNAVYEAVGFFKTTDSGEPRLCAEYEGCSKCEDRILAKALKIIQLKKEQSNAEINARTE